MIKIPFKMKNMINSNRKKVNLDGCENLKIIKYAEIIQFLIIKCHAVLRG